MDRINNEDKVDGVDNGRANKKKANRPSIASQDPAMEDPGIALENPSTR